MSTDTLERLINRRSNYKGRLKRIYNFVDEQKNHEKIFELQTRQTEMAGLYEKYNTTQEDIEMIDDQATKSHEQERASTEEKYFSYAAKIAEILKEHELNRSASSCQSVLQPNLKPSVTKIPNLQIPSFDGNLTEWSSFKSLFDGVIDSHEQLTHLQKFQYLKSLLRGEAAGLIDSLTVTEENYQHALSILTKRYDNKLITVNFHLKNILSVTSISKINLKNFLTRLQQSLDSLKALNVPVDTWDLILIYIIIQKLDQSLRSAWELDYKCEELPKLSQLLDFLNHRARAFELMYDQNQNVMKPNTQIYNKPKLTRVSTHVGTVTSSCSLCNMSHELYKCPSFLEMSAVKRNDYVKSNKLCFNCLKPYRFQHTCSKNSCSICSKKHHTAIHIDNYSLSTRSGNTAAIVGNTQNKLTKEKVPDSQSKVSTNNFSDNKQASVMHLHSDQVQVYLSTAVIKVQQDNGEWTTCLALLDSGSQVCLITKQLANKLSLPLSNKKVTEQISTKLPQNYIPLANFKLPKEYELADPTFNVPKAIDLLIGGHLFYSLLLQGSIQLEI
ncbi:PREDICTED: uncharacterized protein LOC106125857 [Papilio xuthus]|uniref:Uncharacterized protein LOC106125857 n=1 Tax=Papilio xuthus TaxID=66420 RepID=A0AAJ6ZTG9_PAPXU|nr:PREDICTED: uncharacterized protein LOC106125857 [Papilio xuthus]